MHNPHKQLLRAISEVALLALSEVEDIGTIHAFKLEVQAFLDELKAITTEEELGDALECIVRHRKMLEKMSPNNFTALTKFVSKVILREKPPPYKYQVLRAMKHTRPLEANLFFKPKRKKMFGKLR